MICSHCRTEQPDGGKFCGACGAQVAFHCRWCGAVNPDWFAYCAGCGRAVEEAAAVAAPGPTLVAVAPSPAVAGEDETDATVRALRPDAETWQRLGLAEGERRRVTVLFADVSGFTAMSEKMDPEEAKIVVQDVMSELGAIIRSYDGYIEKFIGDAICAIYGAPVAHEDEPERAVRAALDMHAALKARAERRPDLPELSMHIGVNTGLVIAGTVGDGTQFGVTGDTINTTARLMDKAVKYQTFVSAETARRVRHRFLLEDVGTFQMKGKEIPVPAFNVVRELTDDEAAQVSRLRAALVGRDEEMRTLVAAAHRTAREKGGATVVVVGEAGTGKSRLLEELPERVGDEMDVFRGVARVHGARPFGVIADAVRPLLDALDEGPEREVVRAVLGEGTAAGVADVERALARALVRQSGRRPLAILLDDFENADPASVGLFRFLANATCEGDVLWVVATRPGTVAFDAIALEGATVSRLRLRPLGAEATAELFEGLLPGALPHDVRLRLAERAEGNPEFATEIALSLVEEGVVVEAAGGWRLVGDPDRLEIPGTLQELIEARIDALPDAARVTLQEASVIGMHFSAALLERVASIPANLEGSLAELVDAELLQPPGLLDERAQYVFRSALVREVAYQSLLRRRRPPVHLKVAEALLALEPGGEEAIADVLAHHYEVAGEIARAVHYLDLASDQAERAYSYPTAATLAGHALSLRAGHPGAVGDEQVAVLFERRGHARMAVGDAEGALSDLADAAGVYEALGRPGEQARVDDRAAWFMAVAQRVDDAEAHATRAAVVAAEHDLPAVAAGSRVTLLLCRGARGDVAGALAEMPAVAEAAAAAGDPAIDARAQVAWGMLEEWQGDAVSAARRLRAARDRTIERHTPVLFGQATFRLLLAELEQGRYGEALRLAEEYRDHCEETGDRLGVVRALSAMGAMHRELGDLDGAERLARSALTVLDLTPGPLSERAAVLLNLADVALDRGDADEVAARLAPVAELVSSDGWLGWRLGARYEVVQARAARARGDWAGVQEAVGRLRRWLGDNRRHKDRARADWLEGEALLAQGDEAGTALLDEARQEAEALGSPVVLAEVQLALARSVPERAVAARAAASEALALLRGAAPPDLAGHIDESALGRELAAVG